MLCLQYQEFSWSLEFPRQEYQKRAFCSKLSTMAQATAGNDNQLDDLFDYDVDTEIPDLNIDLNPLKRRPEKSSSSRKIDLGIDEEIKIKRVRRPPVKLDAERYAFFFLWERDRKSVV